MDRILILGGGASGVLLALHLLKQDRPAGSIVLVERRDELGAGIAYATRHPDHLLNVRAAQMSAYPDDTGHFVRWLAAQGTAGPTADTFARRSQYRDYLAALLAPHLASGHLGRVTGEAIALTETDSGVEVELGDGRRLAGAVAVMATGNEGPAYPPAPWRHEGWGDPGPCRLDPEAPVVVVGTGLTMVDRVLWLLHERHRGPITAVSRRGLLPLAHRAGVAPLSIRREDLPLGAPLTVLLRWLRRTIEAAETEGQDWRAVMDGLRPLLQTLWAALPIPERRRFLRHGQTLWNVHRHRIAPGAEDRLRQAAASGQLRIIAGRVSRFDPTAEGVDVTVERRVGGEDRLSAVAVFECRGRTADIRRTDNPLLGALLGRGIARPDPLGLGLDVTEACALIDADGRASARLYALGPVTAGTFWEITAVPDIRVQASRLAATLGAAKARAESGLRGGPAPSDPRIEAS